MVGSIGSTGGMDAALITQMQDRLFQATDTDGDGKITTAEMAQVQQQGSGGPGIEDLFTRADADGDGALTQLELESELAKLHQEMQQPRGPEELFGRIDTDGDGTVTEEEFVSNRPEDVSEEQAREMWGRLDADGTGSLSESQFTEAMEGQRPPPGGPGGRQEPPEPSSAGSAEATLSDSGKSEAVELIQAFLEAINKYASAAEESNPATEAGSNMVRLLSTLA